MCYMEWLWPHTCTRRTRRTHKLYVLLKCIHIMMLSTSYLLITTHYSARLDIILLDVACNNASLSRASRLASSLRSAVTVGFAKSI